MMRTRFATALFALLLMAGTAQALTFAERVERQLRADGFVEVTVSRTLLGRTLIYAIGPAGTREIVIDPRNGEILRDLWTRTDKEVEVGHLELHDENDDSGQSGGGSGGSGGEGGGDSGSGGSEGGEGGEGGEGSDDGGEDDEDDEDDKDDEDKPDDEGPDD